MFFRKPLVDPNLIQVSGNIEITDAEVRFKMAGCVSSRPFEKGLLVQKEDLIATLDDAELKSELALRQAELRGGVDGCAKYRETLTGLTAFERDVLQHVHLENNILLPRAQSLIAE